MSSLTPPAAAEQLTEDTTTHGVLTLEVGPMAHGGHCVARHDGRVVFVRHAIPGEIVRAQITSGGESARFWRADTIEVLRSSEFRRAHQWKLADSIRAYSAGRQPVGGAEFGHITLEHQRRLKAQVFRDTLDRLGDLQLDAHVTGIAEDEPTGLHWRTRNAFAVTPQGRLAKNVHRSADVVPVRNIPLAIPELDALHLWDIDFTGATRVEVATPNHGDEALVVIFPDPKVAKRKADLDQAVAHWQQAVKHLPRHVSVAVGVRREKFGPLKLIRLRGRTWVQERVEHCDLGKRNFRISGDGFWQVHRDAPETLVNAVIDAADLQPGQVVADLYAGAGLFSAFLGRAVGKNGAVLSVEAAPGASKDAVKNLFDLKQVSVLNGRTDRIICSWLAQPENPIKEGGLDGRQVDVVVLDPPRSGAGRKVITGIHELAPEKIVYVSCDPASFARDARWLTENGWEIDSSHIYDLFPDTFHMEMVSVFTPGPDLR